MNKGLKIFLCIICGIAVIIGGFAAVNAIHEQSMNEYIDSFARVEIEGQLTPEYDELGAYFTTDGDFKIMHITDVHIGGGIISISNDKKAINAVAAMITAEKPDLVVATGDISYAVPWTGTINNAYAHRYFIRLMENLGVYWTVTFGNHDSEIYDYHDRAAVADIYDDSSLKYCLFDKGPENVFGECNHAITVRNSEGLITQSLIMMDTNSYTDEDPLGIKWLYDNIHEDQIDWYKKTIESHNAYNNALIASDLVKETSPVKSLLFVHIPLIEVKDAYNNYLGAGEKDTADTKYIRGKVGESGDYVYCSKTPDQMFETILSLGSTKAIFYGHDHLNNIMLEYQGITLSYGYSIDYLAYAGIDKIGSQRGCAVITCHPDSTFDILHENYYQDKYAPLYEKEVVDLTN